MSQSAPDPSVAGIKVLPDDIEKLLPVESPAALSGGITLTANDSLRTSPYLNHKIRNICLILSVMVVLNHSRTLDFEYGRDGIVLSRLSPEQIVKAPFEIGFQHLLSGAMGRITNPFFFMASGFLFFFAWKPTVPSWSGKIRKRIYTLMLPYLVWSFIGKSMNYLLYLVDNASLFGEGGEGGPVSSWEAIKFFLHMPLPPQLWFLRALMVIILFTPLLAGVIRLLREKTLLLILVFYLSPFQTPWGELSKSAICFFAVGATLGFVKADLTLSTRGVQKSLFGIWIVLAGSYSLLSMFSSWDLSLLFDCMVISGITGIWAMYDLLPESAHAWLSGYAPYRFFIYMASEPLLTILQYKYFELIRPSQLNDMVEYLGLPFFVVLLCGTTGYLLRRRAERFYLFLSGGR